MDKKGLRELRVQGQDVAATVHVSEPEVGTAVVEELERQLKKRQLVKVKLLKGCTDRAVRKGVAGELAQRTGSELVEVRGNTVLLFKERK